MSIYSHLQRANSSGASIASVKDSNASNDSASQQSSDGETAPQSNLVFGYLNLFSDGVVSLCTSKFSSGFWMYSGIMHTEYCEYFSTTLRMVWPWEVHSYCMVQLEGGLEHYSCLHTSFLKRLFSIFIPF